MTCSCLLAAEVSVSTNGNCTDGVCNECDRSEMAMLAMLLASIDPPGDIGVLHRESTSGYINKQYISQFINYIWRYFLLT